ASPWATWSSPEGSRDNGDAARRFPLAGQGNEGAAEIGNDEFRQFFQRLDVGSFPTVRRVERKADQPHTQIPARVDGRRAVGAVGAEGVALMGDAVVLGELYKMPRYGQIERPGSVAEGDGRGVVAGRLTGTGDAIVHGHKLLNLLAKSVRPADAHLLGNRDHHLRRHRRFAAAVGDGFQRGEQARHPRLVVQMARNDEAIVQEFGLRIDGNNVSDVDGVEWPCWWC